MPVPRFYCPIALSLRPQAWLPQEAAYHATRVLRLKPGDRVTVFNAEEGEFDASIQSAGKEGVLIDIGAARAVQRESFLAVELAQSLCTGEKMDYTLQKSVELGVSGIHPVSTERSVVRLTGERAQKREEHWRKVVIAACEQCGRNRVPEVRETCDFPRWLASGLTHTLRLVLSPSGDITLRDLPRPQGSVLLLAGPEGGFTATEHAMAEANGFVSVRLGPRILRTETAALVALAALQTLWGDLLS
jgi:16S rRNA (uracil1498-N3)-methyltransferase